MAGWCALLVALIAAMSPAWRVLLLDADPTLDELLQLLCSTTTSQPR